MATKLNIKHIKKQPEPDEVYYVPSRSQFGVEWKVEFTNGNYYCECPAYAEKEGVRRSCWHINQIKWSKKR